MSDRPDRPGSTKRRPGDQLNKDNYEDEVEGEGPDPGEWRPADEGAIKARRKIHVRRGGQAAETAQSAEAGSNPFASIALAPPAQTGGNPFAGISLLPPGQANGSKGAADTAAAKPEDGEPASDQPTEAAAAADGKENSTAPAAAASTAAPASTGGFAGLAAGNPFSSLGGKPFGGGFGGGFGGTGGGFGALAAAGGTFGASTGGATGSAAPALGGGFGSGFNFGNSAFPAVSSTPLGAAPAFRAGSTGGAGGGAAAAGEGGEDEEAGEGGEGAGEGGEDVALFGNSTVQPVVSLPEQAKRTGEEEEAVLFSADGSLFEFDTAANRWRERGKGEFKVNASQSSDAVKQTRMVMRQAANLRLLLNAKVYQGMPLQLMPSNVGVTFGVINAAGTSASGNEGGSKESEAAGSEGASATAGGAAAKPTTWAVKIKSSDKVIALHELLNTLKTPAAEGATEPAGQDAV